ncbi:MAG: branched-chain amino acid transport system substrate-binding protein [Acidimicrobiales bacterium]|jgi:branched-chain amino acid transport system substrate-binding protein
MHAETIRVKTRGAEKGGTLHEHKGEVTMSKQRLLRLLSLLFAFSMIAAACGGSSDSAGGTDDGDTAAEGGGDDEQEAGGVDANAAEEAVAGTDDETDEGADDEEPMAEPQNIEELEAAWAARRQPIVDMLTTGIEAGDYGIGDDNILHGPGGLEVDFGQCPADWSDTEGIGETIKIGHTTAQSGNLAAYGNIAVGMEAYFNYVNEAHGGINGVPIEVIIKDDAYVATQTIELIDELLQSDKPFAITTLGSPNTLAVYDTINNNCVPHPFVQTGHPAWGDPENHPWTSGLQLNYATEAILWGAWIKENMADQLPVTVAGLVMDNDFGAAYEIGFQDYADANPDVVADFNAVRHDPAAPTVTNEMTTIAAGEPDVFISMTAGNPCLLAVEEAARSGLTESGAVLFMPQTCKDPNAYLIPAGDSGDGFFIVGGGYKATTDPQYIDDPAIAFINETLEAAGIDTSVGLYGNGFGLYAWPHVETLRIAADLPGGLSRSNYLMAMRSLDLLHPLTLEGIRLTANGNEDAYYIEGSEFSRYDAANQSWIQEGPAIDLNGSSPNCVWGDGGC